MVVRVRGVERTGLTTLKKAPRPVFLGFQALRELQELKRICELKEKAWMKNVF